MAWSPGQARACYDRLRKRYFMDGQGITPPLGKELRWVWLPVGSPFRGAVLFDQEGHPHTLELNMGLLEWPGLLRTTLLHELTHIRLGPTYACPSETRNSRVPAAWKKEAIRLAALGAPLL